MAAVDATRAGVGELDLDLDLVAAASSGDREAFGVLFERHRRAIQAHCYRLLGSLQDAEDVTQETFLRAWRRLGSFEGRSSLRTWLYRIATNAALDVLERAPRRVLPPAVASHDDPTRAALAAAPEIPWLEPYPDRLLEPREPAALVEGRETMELAFLAAIQHLPPRQRAVLVLRDLLAWSAAETASLLGTTVPATNSALQRARATLRERLPASHLELPAARAAAEAERELVARYVRAWDEADVAALVALLKEDATLSMPPSPSWYAGRDAIRLFVETAVFDGRGRRPKPGEMRLVPTRANRAPAVALYLREPGDESFRAFAIKVLSLSADGRVESIDAFAEPALFRFFALPDVLAG